jgi:hypothetical protein
MPQTPPTQYLDVFAQCATDARHGVLIKRESKTDKEFHFQNWFGERLDAVGQHHDIRGRNTYPDFTMVNSPEGFEIKGLAYPGRTADYDSNSQVPTGRHNGRELYYVFGRYPAKIDGNEYPVIDLVICHGSFLNADKDYVHENKSVRGFGSYGDVKIRDRKMYIVPTPFALASGTIAQRTLIVPASFEVDDRFVDVGDLVRVEAEHLVIGYQFNLETNDLSSTTRPNPNAGRTHAFKAYRLAGDNDDVRVSLTTA